MRTTMNNRPRARGEPITTASLRAGRRSYEITLPAVTNTGTAGGTPERQKVVELMIGENRPKDRWDKAAALPATVLSHLICYLQRNKVVRTLPLVQLIHSVDSLRLLAEIEKEAGRQGRPVGVLLEVNASHEASKQGFAPEEVPG